MLKEDEVKKNAKQYFESGQQYGALNDSLIEFLGTDIISAPASPKNDMNNSFEGGLIDHMLRVAKYAVNLNSQLHEKVQVDKSTLVKISLLHQIGKTYLFKANTSQWHIDNLGENYVYNEELIAMRIGERSAYYAMKHGIELSEEEYQAVVNFDKEFDKQSKYFTNNLGKILKQANEMAIMEEKEVNKK